MTTQLIAVNFHEQSLIATLVDNIPYVAMKPICESIGIDWEGQRQKISRHPVLNSTACMIKAVAEDGNLREMLMLPIKYLNGWLFGIDTNRVKNGTREKLIEYQRECFDVLASHFMPQLSATTPEPPTRKSLPGGLSLAHQDDIKALVKKNAESLPKDKQAGATIKQWSAIKKKFGCSYKEIPDADYLNVISLLSRLPLEGEVLEKPKPANDSVTFALAPLPAGVRQRRWLVVQHGEDFMQFFALGSGSEAREQVIRELRTDGYIVLRPEEFVSRLTA